MPITINGTGTITGVSTGGLPDGVVQAADLDGAQSGSAPIYGARAWCNFNGSTTGTNAPRAGGNVTSVTRNGTGDWTINFTTAMPDTNYGVHVTGAGYATNNATLIYGIYGSTSGASGKTTSSVRITCAATNAVQWDNAEVNVVIFR